MSAATVLTVLDIGRRRRCRLSCSSCSAAVWLAGWCREPFDAFKFATPQIISLCIRGTRCTFFRLVRFFIAQATSEQLVFLSSFWSRTQVFAVYFVYIFRAVFYYRFFSPFDLAQRSVSMVDF